MFIYVNQEMRWNKKAYKIRREKNEKRKEEVKTIRAKKKQNKN